MLDYELPDMNGMAFLSKLQCSLSQQISVPVIVITGQGNETIAVQSIKAGAQDYLVKEKITPDDLQLAREKSDRHSPITQSTTTADSA